jgi:hypothetical protein
MQPMTSSPTAFRKTTSVVPLMQASHLQRSGNFIFTEKGLKHSAEKLESLTGVQYRQVFEANNQFYQQATHFIKQDDTFSRLIFPRNEVLPEWSPDHLAPFILVSNGLKRFLSLDPYFSTKRLPAFKETRNTKVALPETAKTKLQLMEDLVIKTHYQVNEPTNRPIQASLEATYHPYHEKKNTHPLRLAFTVGQYTNEIQKNERPIRQFLGHLLQAQGLKEGARQDFIIERPSSPK